MSDEAKHWLDWAAISTTVATIAGWLPSIAALFGIIWTGLRIFEWIENRYRQRPKG